jgi:hypothetical protein
MPGILGNLMPPKPAKKHEVPKKGGENGHFHTQVGELDDEAKEPTPAMKIKKAAVNEKHYATQDWIAGRISDKHHKKVHSRANFVIKNAHKLTKSRT